MSAYDPNFVSVAFASASAGYLGVMAAELPLLKANLPRPATVRERAIYAAIEFGIANPVEWNRRLRRMR